MQFYGKKVFIIAEAGVNHNGSLSTALEMVDIAANCKVDSIKFQTFSTDEVVTKFAAKAEYQKTSGTGNTQYEMIRELELSRQAFIQIKQHCEKHDILFLSTPFDLGSLDFLVELNLPIIKIASGDITNAPLLYQAALTNKPIILSTGMTTLPEIEEALGVLALGYIDKESTPCIEKFKGAYLSESGQIALKEKVTLLHCTSAYPTPYDEVNLNAIDTLQEVFDLPVGYSDHTLGIYATLGAISHGAVVIEKHFTLNKNQIGPDHLSSLTPHELKNMVEAIRIMEQCQGSKDKFPTVTEMQNKPICRRSLVTRVPIKKGEKFSTLSITAKRPAGGIPPIRYWEWLEKCAAKDFQADEMVS